MDKKAFRETGRRAHENMMILDRAYSHGESFPKEAYVQAAAYGAEWLNHAIDQKRWMLLAMMLPTYQRLSNLEETRQELKYETPVSIPLTAAIARASVALSARKHKVDVTELDLPQKIWYQAAQNSYVIDALADRNFASALAISSGWTDRKVRVEDRIVEPDGTCLKVARLDRHAKDVLASYLEAGVYAQRPVIVRHKDGVSISIRTVLDMSEDTVDLEGFTNVAAYRRERLDDSELPTELQGLHLGRLNEETAVLATALNLKRNKQALDLTEKILDTPDLSERIDVLYKQVAALPRTSGHKMHLGQSKP